jgi:hypothetical protein
MPAHPTAEMACQMAQFIVQRIESSERRDQPDRQDDCKGAHGDNSNSEMKTAIHCAHRPVTARLLSQEPRLHFQDLHTCRAGLLRHVGRASPAWKSDNEIRLSFLEHLSVSNRTSRAAAALTICRERPNENAFVLAELAGQCVSSSGTPFDDFGDAVIAVDLVELDAKRRRIIE